MKFILDAVDRRHQDRREGKIRIAAGIGAAEFDPLGLGARRIHRNAATGRSVPLRIGQIHRRLIPGHEPLVAVGGGIGDGQQRRGVPKNAAEGVEGHLGEPCIA